MEEIITVAEANRRLTEAKPGAFSIGFMFWNHTTSSSIEWEVYLCSPGKFYRDLNLASAVKAAIVAATGVVPGMGQAEAEKADASLAEMPPITPTDPQPEV